MSIPLEAFASNVSIGTVGLYAAVQESVAAFRQAPKDAPKAFIYTGNSASDPNCSSRANIS